MQICSMSNKSQMLNLHHAKKFILNLNPCYGNTKPFRDILFLLSHPKTKETGQTCHIEKNFFDGTKISNIEIHFNDETKIIIDKAKDV